MNQISGNNIATNQANAAAGSNKDGTPNANADATKANAHSAPSQNDNKSDANASLSTGNANQAKDCVGCGVPCNRTNASPQGALCNSCHHHWRYSSHINTYNSYTHRPIHTYTLVLWDTQKNAGEPNHAKIWASKIFKWFVARIFHSFYSEFIRSFTYIHSFPKYQNDKSIEYIQY